MAEMDILMKKIHEMNKYVQDRERTENRNSTVRLIKTSELTALSIYYRDIAALVDAGYLEKVKQGYYHVLAENEIFVPTEASVIASLYPDGVLSMYTALFYYGYIDRSPLFWDIAIDRNTSKARFKMDYPCVRPYYMKSEHLVYGIRTVTYKDCDFRIFDRDRLICECIKNENKMDRESYIRAIRGYAADSEKSVANLLLYAQKRNIAVKVKDRIEIWL